MPTLKLIRGRISRYEPNVVSREPGGLEAAVALIVREPGDRPPEILFIERAVREGDPWSGQMAFPGGRRDPTDPDLPTTAVRETREEVGVSLGVPIGRLDDVQGTKGLRERGFVVSPFVFDVDRRPRLRTSAEVQEAVWIPIPDLLHPNASVEYRLRMGRAEASFPAVRYERYTIWGLTYRILGRFFEILGKEIPAPDPP